ncbi:MAG: hypothetical protein P1P85_01125 [Patescibacteria group bacterium]|nr:hypothetical protein [Patescibacteria group bacterium]
MQNRIKKSIIKKSFFDNEMKLCQKLAKENKGKCGWGKCKDCGVSMLLIKLCKGRLVEDKSEIKKIKNEIIGI